MGVKRRTPSAAATALALLLAAASCTPSSDEPGSVDTDPATTTETTATPAPAAEPERPFVTDLGGATGFSNERDDVLGNPIWATGPGNVPVSADFELAVRFRTRTTGLIERVSFNLKYDFERPGYHGGSCGQLEVSLRPDSAGTPADDVLGSVVLDDPCGGERDIGWLVDVAFDQPIEVTGGETHHLVFRNLDPDPDNFFSINLLYRPDDAGPALELSTDDGVLAVQGRGSVYWSGNETGGWGASDVLANHFPAFELAYSDGTRQGVSYVGARFGQEVVIDAASPTRFRELFTPTRPRSVHRLWFRGVESSPDASVAAWLTGSGGERLWSGILERDGTSEWFTSDLQVPLVLDAGEQYALEIGAATGQIEVRPLYQAKHDDWISDESSDWAATQLEVGVPGAWEPYVPGVPHDLSLFFESTEPTPRSGALQVVVYGDSLLGEPIVEASFRAAFEARGLGLAELNSESGRTAAQLAELVATTPTEADLYLINIGINGEPTAAQFEQQVRATVESIREESPDARIVWSTIHALPTRFSYIVDDRVTPRNEILNRLGAEGVIEVVDWAAVGSAHPEIYGDDGVHFFGHEDVYLDTLIGALDALGW